MGRFLPDSICQIKSRFIQFMRALNPKVVQRFLLIAHNGVLGRVWQGLGKGKAIADAVAQGANGKVVLRFFDC